MFEHKMKELYKRKIKRRRTRKNRLSANKIYVSKTEIKHTNLKLVIIFYVYNKQKLLIERYMRKILHFLGFIRIERDKVDHVVKNSKNRTFYLLERKYLFLKK